eukprot:s3075_g3.t1
MVAECVGALECTALQTLSKPGPISCRVSLRFAPEQQLTKENVSLMEKTWSQRACLNSELWHHACTAKSSRLLRRKFCCIAQRKASHSEASSKDQEYTRITNEVEDHELGRTQRGTVTARVAQCFASADTFCKGRGCFVGCRHR